uniref:hypothetical protein n=1 Tax=uncultured Brachyspira sp. TaxID=221953 RepID=UPI00261EC540
RINFTSHLGYEIGHDYVIYDAPTDLKPISEFNSFVCSQCEENSTNDDTFSHLCSLYSSSPFPDSFFARRQSFVRSLTCNQFLRNLFCLPQTNFYMFSSSSFKVPVLYGEYHVPPIDPNLAESFVFQIPSSSSDFLQKDNNNLLNNHIPIMYIMLTYTYIFFILAIINYKLNKYIILIFFNKFIKFINVIY